MDKSKIPTPIFGSTRGEMNWNAGWDACWEARNKYSQTLIAEAQSFATAERYREHILMTSPHMREVAVIGMLQGILSFGDDMEVRGARAKVLLDIWQDIRGY